MALTKVGCPECGGKEKHCPACDGTNEVYITSVDGHLSKERIHANYIQAWEKLQQVVKVYQEDIEESLKVISQTPLRYSIRTQYRFEGEFRAYKYVLSLIAELAENKNL